MELEKAIKIKNRVVAIENIDNTIKKLKDNYNTNTKIHFVGGNDNYNYLTIDQPYEIDDIVDFMISQYEKIKTDLINQLKNDNIL